MLSSKLKKLGQAGLVLPLAMVLLAAATFMIVPGLWSMQTLMVTNRETEQDARAHYAAESGITDAFWRWFKQSTPPFAGSPPSYILASTVNGMSVKVTKVSEVSGGAFTTTYTIKSEAILNGKTLSTVYSEIMVNSGSSPFKYGVVSLGGDITISNNSVVTSTPAHHGDIFSNASIHMYNTSKIDGTAGAVGTIDCSHVTYGCSPGQSSQTFPTVDMTWYQQQANSGGTYSGTLNIWNNSPTQNIGPKHITGNLQIGQSTVNLNGVVWVDGNMDMNNSSRLIAVDRATSYVVVNGTININTSSTTTNYPTFISLKATSPGSYAININSAATPGSLYAPYGGINLSNGGTMVYGSVVGKFVNIDSGAGVNYPVNLLQTYPIPGISGGSGSFLTKFSSQ